MKAVTRFQIGGKPEFLQEGILDIPLYKGMKVSFNSKCEPYEIVGWSYFRDGNSGEAGLLITLKDQEIVSETQEQLNLVSAAVTVILALVAIFLVAVQPTIVKGALGAVIQPVVGIGSWLSLIAAGIYAEAKLPDNPRLGSYLRWLFAFSGVFVGFTLAVAIAPGAGDKLIHFPDDYAKYFEESVRTYQASWKILYGIIGIPLGIWAWFFKAKGKLDESLENLGAAERK